MDSFIGYSSVEYSFLPLPHEEARLFDVYKGITKSKVQVTLVAISQKMPDFATTKLNARFLASCERLNNPNLLQLLDFGECKPPGKQQKCWVLVYERSECLLSTHLYAHLHWTHNPALADQPAIPLSQLTRNQIARGMANGLNALHQHKIYHSGSADSTLWTARVLELPFLRPLQDSIVSEIGPIEYQPREQRSVDVNHNMVDSWSLGCVLYELVEGKLLAAAVVDTTRSAIPYKAQLPATFPADKYFEIFDLLTGFLEIDPTKRLSIEDAFHHPYLSEPGPRDSVVPRQQPLPTARPDYKNPVGPPNIKQPDPPVAVQTLPDKFAAAAAARPPEPSTTPSPRKEPVQPPTDKVQPVVVPEIDLAAVAEGLAPKLGVQPPSPRKAPVQLLGPTQLSIRLLLLPKAMPKLTVSITLPQSPAPDWLDGVGSVLKKAIKQIVSVSDTNILLFRVFKPEGNATLQAKLLPDDDPFLYNAHSRNQIASITPSPPREYVSLVSYSYAGRDASPLIEAEQRWAKGLAPRIELLEAIAYFLDSSHALLEVQKANIVAWLEEQREIVSGFVATSQLDRIIDLGGADLVRQVFGLRESLEDLQSELADTETNRSLMLSNIHVLNGHLVKLRGLRDSDQNKIVQLKLSRKDNDSSLEMVGTEAAEKILLANNEAVTVGMQLLKCRRELASISTAQRTWKSRLLALTATIEAAKLEKRPENDLRSQLEALKREIAEKDRRIAELEKESQSLTHMAKTREVTIEAQRKGTETIKVKAKNSLRLLKNSVLFFRRLKPNGPFVLVTPESQFLESSTVENLLVFLEPSSVPPEAANSDFLAATVSDSLDLTRSFTASSDNNFNIPQGTNYFGVPGQIVDLNSFGPAISIQRG